MNDSALLFPRLDAIATGETTANAVALIGAYDQGRRGGYITGADALIWYSAALAADDLVLVVWPAPQLPAIVYGGDPTTLEDRLRNGTVVLVAGGGLSPDVGMVVHSRTETPTAAVELFGFDGIVATTEAPLSAAVRRFGDPATATELFALNGTTVTVRVPDDGAIADELAGRFGFAVSRTPAALAGPTVLARCAWTRSLGAFQLIDDPGVGEAAGDMLRSDEPTAVIVGRAAAADAVTQMLDRDAEPDIVVSGPPGAPSSVFDDLTLVFGGEGAVVLTGHAVPPADTVIVRGDAAESLLSPAVGAVPGDSGSGGPGVVVGPAPAEDRSRFLAHSWARSQRVWAGEPGDGSPTLAGEAVAIGAIPITDADLAPAQPASVVAAIATARDWHPIDPAVHASLAPIAAVVAAQAADAGRDLVAAELDTLLAFSAEPGAWVRLVAAYEPPSDDAPQVWVFPFPAPTVELLRAAVAADGDAAELRRLIGPIKVALRRELTRHGLPSADNEEATR
jgi:hypothetical protein